LCHFRRHQLAGYWEGWAFAGLTLPVLLVRESSFPYGAVPKWCAVYVLAVFCCYMLARARYDRFDLSVSALVVFAAASWFWAIDPLGVVPGVINWIALGIVVLAARRVRDFTPVLAAVTLGSVVVTFEAWFRPGYFGGFGNENFITEFLLIAAPFILAGPWPWAAVFPAAYVIGVNGSRLELVAAGAWFAWVARWWCVLLIPAAGVGYWLGDFNMSVAYRLDAWRAAWAMFLAAPWMGHGLGGFDTQYLAFAAAGQSLVNSDVYTPGATHSEPLQLLAELGLVGAALVALVGIMAWQCRGDRQWPVWVLAAVLGLSLVDFPLQHPGSGLLAAIALGAATQRRAGNDFNWVAVPALVVAALLVVAGVQQYRAQRAFARTFALFETHPPVAHYYNEAALAAWPYSKRIRWQLMSTALRSGADHAAIMRAIAAAESAYPHHPRIARAEELEWTRTR